MSGILYTGLKPNKHGIIDIDGHLVGNDFCGDPAEFPAEDNCTSLIDVPRMKTDFAANCHLKKNCTLNLRDYLRTGDTSRPLCLQDFAYQYVSYKCEYHNGEDIVNHQLSALNVVACAAFITIIYRLVLFFRESTTGLDFKLWDVQTCTPADYTI